MAPPAGERSIRDDPRRRRWRIPPDLRQPLGRAIGLDTDVAGSIGSPTLRYGDEEPKGLRLVEPIDVWTIIAAPASGTVEQLVELEPGRRQHRTYIDSIAPYLEGAGGAPILGPRIPGAGVEVLWQLRIDNRAWAPYARIDTILAPWSGATGRRSLVEIQPGQTASIWVSFTDPFGVYAYVGVRVQGRFVPRRRREDG